MSKDRSGRKLPATSQHLRVTRTILPILLQPRDRLADEQGVWEVVNRPWSTRGGKLAHATVQKPGEPNTRRDKNWGAHCMGGDAMACRPAARRETHCDEPMAKPKTEKKAAIAAPVSRVLRRDLQLGDRLVDERGEWRVSDEDASPGWAARLR